MMIFCHQFDQFELKFLNLWPSFFAFLSLMCASHATVLVFSNVLESALSGGKIQFA